MTRIWVVIARLSFIPELKIRFLLIRQALVSRLRKRLVSQLVRVTLATVKRPFWSMAGVLEISSTRKSSTLALSSPPMPSEGTDHPDRPNRSSTGRSVTRPPPQSLMLENSLEMVEQMSVRILAAFLPFAALT